MHVPLTWLELVAVGIKHRMKLVELEPTYPFKHSLPRMPASEAEIARAERARRAPFPDDLRLFLRTCSGIPYFGQFSVFGAQELCGEGLFAQGAATQQQLRDEPASQGCDLGRAFPVAVVEGDEQVMLLDPRDGEVWWFAGGVVLQRFLSFRTCVEHMVELLAHEVENARAARAGG